MCVGSAVYQTIGQFALLRLQTGFKAFPSLSHYVLLYHKAYNFILLYCTNCIWLQLFSDHVTKVRNPIWRFFCFCICYFRTYLCTTRRWRQTEPEVDSHPALSNSFEACEIHWPSIANTAIRKYPKIAEVARTATGTWFLNGISLRLLQESQCNVFNVWLVLWPKY